MDKRKEKERMAIEGEKGNDRGTWAEERNRERREM
jgi:hypothetical protein